MESTPHPKPLRVWPGAAAAAVLAVSWIVVPVALPDYAMFGMFGAAASALVIILWWLFFSRAPWLERIGAIVLMVIAVVGFKRIVDPSVAGGMMGNMLAVFGTMAMSLALGVSAAASRRFPTGRRRMTMGAAIVLACAALALLRTGGITGDARSDLHWRWTPTPEDRLLAQKADEPKILPAAPAAVETPKEPIAAPAGEAPATAPTAAPPTKHVDTRATAPASGKPVDAARADAALHGEDSEGTKIDAAEWPGFRGPQRDGVVRGVRIETDWTAKPPVAIWRRAIGPGWSSFAVRGDLLYTQEQRGADEVVASYKVSTGEPVWWHRDPVRFYESNGGAGPRGTPALSSGRVYAFGATGILNALDARSGAVLWSRKAAAEAGVKTPGWGFSSSPLVVDDLVIVAASGALAAYDRRTGEARWTRKSKGGSYSSPQLATIDGVPQVLFLSAFGVTALAPATGALLWEFAWNGVPIVQPALTADGDVLITTADAMGGYGMRRLALAHGAGGWTPQERWMSNGLKPYFNDYVVHKGYAFGFDNSILACIDLQDGTRKWKGGRYGHGQLVVLPDQDLLLVLSEEGELALVSATPDQFTEIARARAIEGKTWNHPVLVGDTLLVRNGEEMAAFHLTLAAR